LFFKDNAKFIIFFFFSILNGYVFSWVIKWILTYVVGDKEVVLAQAKNTIIYRTRRDSFIEGLDADWLDIVFRTFKFLQTKPLDGNFFLLLILFNLIFISYFIFLKPRKFINQSPFYFFTLLPFVFFLLVANWSAIHTFISYRALVFSLIFVTALNLVNFNSLMLIQKSNHYDKITG
jgi:hypothetical protein